MKNLLGTLKTLAIPLIASIAMMLTSCAPTNSGTFSSSVSKTSSTNTASSSSSSGSVSSDSQAVPYPCSQYDSLDPQLTLCKSCYASIQKSKCSGRAPSNCPDSTVRSTYVQLINTCMSQTILSGFSCNKTCAVGYSLNTQSCSCDPVNLTVAAESTL